MCADTAQQTANAEGGLYFGHWLQHGLTCATTAHWCSQPKAALVYVLHLFYPPSGTLLLQARGVLLCLLCIMVHICHIERAADYMPCQIVQCMACGW